MCSTLPGDADEAVCARYCRPSSAHRHCAHCLCASCDFCSDGGTANRIPPLPTRVDHAASRATVDRLRSRFWSSSGVIMRVWECSLAGCAAHYKEATTRAFIKRCARRELETLRTLKRPASMLRWDVPAALYAGGRCVNPAASEDPLYPRVVLEDDARGLQDSHGWRRHGFSGHNVTQAAIGLIFGDLPSEDRGAAFGHDAWAADPKDGVRPAGSDLSPGRACRVGSRTAESYAHARLSIHTEGFRAGFDAVHSSHLAGLHSLQRQAAAYKWGFVNTSYNCLHSDWEKALGEQQAYAWLLSRRGQQRPDGLESGGGGGGGAEGIGEGGRADSPELPECGPWGSLYNQVHVSWRRELAEALFYVNDTVTPRRYQSGASRDEPRGGANGGGGSESGARVMSGLHRQALRAAAGAYALARLARSSLAEEFNLSLPIVQVKFSEECWRGDRMTARLQMMAGSRALLASNHHVAPASSAGAVRGGAEMVELFEVPPKSSSV